MRYQAIVAAVTAVLLSTGVLAEEHAGKGKGSGHGPCREDVEKFCKDVEKGEGRIIKCMREHKDQLSEGCKQKMKHRFERRERRKGRGKSKGEGSMAAPESES